MNDFLHHLWRRSLTERDLHLLFQGSLLLKLAHSLVEIVSGLALAVISGSAIMALADFLTRNELREDPRDLLAGLVERGALSLSMGAKGSAVFFLLSHGLVELVLVAAMLTGKRWAYPAFMFALGLLIAYQTYQLTWSFSGWLFVLTLFDVFVFALTWHEYRVARSING